MVTRLGTTLGTVLGTDLGSFTDGPPVLDTSKVYALSNFGTTNNYRTANDGGEAGVASGFGMLALNVVERIATGAQQSLGRRTTGQGYATGYDQTAPGFVYSFANDGSAAIIGSRITTGLTLSASDVGRIVPTVTAHSGSALSTYAWDGSLKRSTTITGYTPAGAGTATILGAQGADVALAPFATLTYRGAPTDAQIQAVLRAARTLGDLPSKAAAEALMPGTTVTHRWSLRDTLAAANAPVADGAAAPASLADSVTGATADRMDKVGSPIVRAIDPGAYPRTSYGVMGFATASNLQSAPGAGFRGSAVGFTVRLSITFWSIATGIEYVASCANQSGTTGWSFARNAATLSVNVGDGAARAVSKTLTSADLGVPHLLYLVYDGSQGELFYDGVSVGKSAAGGYTPALASAPMVLGALSTAAAYGAATVTEHGFAGANYIATAAEVAADFAAWQQTRTLANITSGKPDANRYDLTADVVANGGPSAGVPATVQDRVGTDHLTRVGTGLVVSQRTERLWSHETTPILYGSTDHSASNYFEAPAGAAGNATAFGGTLVWRPRSGATSATRALVSTQATSPTRGFDIRTSGANASVSMIFLDAANAGRAAGSGTISATNLDKIHVFSFQWDGPNSRLRVYLNRAEIGTGVSITGHAVSPGKLQWGAQAGGAAPAPFNDLYGFRMWDGVASLAQIQAQHDAILASDGRIQPLIGLTNTFEVDVTADCLANGGALPATLLERIGGNNLVRTGSPSAAPQYARAFAA